MASIKNRGKNKWMVRVFLGRERGKVRFHDKLVRGDRKAAKAYADKIEAARDGGTLDQLLNPQKAEVLTLGAYLDRWLSEAVKPTVREAPISTTRPCSSGTSARRWASALCRRSRRRTCRRSTTK